MKKITILFGLACLLSGAMQAAESSGSDSSDGGTRALASAAGKAEDTCELRDSEKAEDVVVPNASYALWDTDWLIRRIRIFYDADGNMLLKTRDTFRKLDPNAPTPRIASYAMRKNMASQRALELYTKSGQFVCGLGMEKRYRVRMPEDEALREFDFSELDEERSRELSGIFQKGKKG